MESSGITSAAPPRARNVRRELSQLLGLAEHALGELAMLRRELASSMTQNVLASIQRAGESGVPTRFEEAAQGIDRAVRSLEAAIEDIQTQLRAPDPDVGSEGLPALPPRLARFLSERRDIDGFHYEIRQDRIRGWVVLWKEFGADGALRGAGQFYERPYAWLED